LICRKKLHEYKGLYKKYWSNQLVNNLTQSVKMGELLDHIDVTLKETKNYLLNDTMSKIEDKLSQNNKLFSEERKKIQCEFFISMKNSVELISEIELDGNKNIENQYNDLKNDITILNSSTDLPEDSLKKLADKVW